jgi:hypothetical protein
VKAGWPHLVTRGFGGDGIWPAAEVRERGGGRRRCEGVGEGLGFLWMRLARAGRT